MKREEMADQDNPYEVFREEWDIFGESTTRSISIEYTKDWDIKIEEYLIGGDLEETYGDCDHEEWIIIKRKYAPMLMKILLEYSLNNDEKLTFTSLKSLLDKNKINYDHGMWA